jgi:dTDP-4-dehydrorhamnose 3,5-epimerase
MINFESNNIDGSYVIVPTLIEDERGFFSRIFCKNEFKLNGLKCDWVQINNSYNKKKYTLRGMHLQLNEYSEIKLVKCIKGSIWDVIVDLRKRSTTYKQWFAVNLTENNKKMIYVPEGCAHGFMTLEDNSELIYFSNNYYSFKSEAILKWNDPEIKIEWPAEPSTISKKDLTGKGLKDINYEY